MLAPLKYIGRCNSTPTVVETAPNQNAPGL
jgi:hypothetical protein